MGFLNNITSKDYKLMLIGTIVSMSIPAAVPHVWDFIKESSFSVLKSFVNLIIRNSSLGDFNYNEIIIMLIIFCSFLIIYLEKAKKVKQLIDGTSGKMQNEGAMTSPPSKQTMKKYLWIGHLMAIFILSVVAITASAIMTQRSLVKSFEQKINILSPFMTDYEVKVIKSEWASMKDIKDFSSVNDKLIKIASANKIELPK
jgi:hypothetical protein